MSKYIYLIISELRENIGKFIFLWIELLISIVAIHLLCGEFTQYLKINTLYHDLNVSDYICAEVKEGTKLSNKNIRWVSENAEPLDLSLSGMNDSYIGIVYSKKQAENIQYEVEGKWFDTTKESNECQAVVSKELSNQFHLGEEYILNQKNQGTILMRVIGYVENEKELFLPNSGEYDSIIGNRESNEIWLYGNIKTDPYKIKGQKVMMISCEKDKSLAVANELKKNHSASGLVLFKNVWKETKTLLESELVEPGIIGLIIIILTILHILSSEILQIKRKEYSFAIFFMNGATRRTCFWIQCMVDLFPVMGAFISAEVMLWFAKKRGQFRELPISGFWLAFLICLGLTILTIRLNTKKLYKKSVIDMMRRRDND